ncbi:DUF2270 domain-containing protein [Halorussus gelatinilyticus]|uniref:DUF2270 domain-containing protein n=1 Tax=Halorussus gelatinilyticus TaxID=2937524 RepID=A0A8U0IM24_9EURY|nr:DUF2270 domain-containing protein [Halorussus gelatinilyticus]UPW02177.1 DUF2270 domain-containing protein [Halorussus gelatinilyticus]
MSEPESDEFDPSAPEQRQIGREMVDESTGLGSVMAHCYRGEMDRVTTWRQRLDQTTTWAVTVMAAILTWAFSSSGNPHYILLIGIVVVAVFLGVEARRYRDYDVFRSRVRLIQENLFANALDPSRDVERKNWRAELSADFRVPTLKVSLQEALANRLRRVYLALLGVLLAAWGFRITAFTPPEQTWLEAAGIAYVPGTVVVALVGAFYAILVGIASWPRERHAKGEFREGDPDDWKETNR